MKYGRFDGNEYVITHPETPRPWVNYLTNGSYCALVSQTGGGFSFYRDFKSDRITRWEQGNIHTDRPGRYIYLRDEATGEYWSPTHQPVQRPLDSFECRHGMGYTTVTGSALGITGRVTYFVPEGDPCEIWSVSLRNDGKKERKLSAYAYCEWLLGGYIHELTRRSIMVLFNRAWYDPKLNAILADRTGTWDPDQEPAQVRDYPFTCFLATDLKADGYDCRKASFIGDFRGEHNPKGLERKRCSQSACCGEEAVGVLQHRLVLKPGQTREFRVILGAAADRSELKRLLRKYRAAGRAAAELEKTRQVWKRRVERNCLAVTPDRSCNELFNGWLKYQASVRSFWGNDLSYYHEGVYGGGGYRDFAQDAENTVSLNPEYAREIIEKLASLTRVDGTTAPGWAKTGETWKMPPRKDHPVWMTRTVAAFVKETGDVGILKQEFPCFVDKWSPPPAPGEARAPRRTVLGHCLAQLDSIYRDLGQHGIPRIGYGDWNDGIDAAGVAGRGESVWIGLALVASLKIAAELCDLTGDGKTARELLKKAATVTRNLQKHGWDGEWYRRGFTDDGTPFGSKQNRGGRIYLNPQAWSIISGVATGKRQERVLRSIDKHLDSEHGLVMLTPTYPKYEPAIGRATMFAPGTKENGTIFNHKIAFTVCAYCMAGEGRKAFEALAKVMPNNQRDHDVYKAEPYVFAQCIIGPDHPYATGEGAFTWVTGSSGWFYNDFFEWILGVRKDYHGLRVDPCLPPHWKTCRVRRYFRGAWYDVTIRNPDGVEKGIREIRLDGKLLKSNLLPPAGDGKEHKVTVLMGR